MDRSTRHKQSGPDLRIVRGDEVCDEPIREPSTDGAIAFPSTQGLVADLKRARAGAEIVKSLVESETRSSITVPNGMTDQDSLLALNALSEQTTGKPLFSQASLLALDYWATVHREPFSHRRTYPVALFIKATAAHDAWEVSRALAKVKLEPGMRLQPADPMEAALVLGAHILRQRGESPAQHLEIRTACEQITLSFFRLRQEIMLTERDPAMRHDSVLMAASPVPSEPSRGILGALKRLVWRDKASA